MRIALVTHGFPPKETTGTEWHSYLLAKELSKKHSVYVFSRGVGENHEEYAEEFDGIPVRRINTPTSHGSFPETYVDDRVALSFSEFLEDSEPDLIHVQHCIGLGISILELAVERRIPTVLFLHDFYLMCHRVHLLKPDGQPCPGPKSQGYCAGCILSFDPSLSEIEARESGLGRYRYVQRLLSKIDRIIVPSEFVRKMFQANFPTIREITVSPLGLDLEFTKKFRKEKSEKLRFGYFGPIYPHKGLHTLIEAFRSLKAKNVELRIQGGGDQNYLNSLRKSAKGSGILFLGPYAHSELSKVLSEIDAFVMPSICHESFSFTIREALAVGIPVIVSNLRAQSDAISEGINGLHFKSGDPDDLREKLKLMAEDTNLVRELSDNAKKSSIRAIDEQAKELAAVYLKSIRAATKRRSLRTEQVFPSGRPLTNILWHIRNLENAKRKILDEERNRLKSELIQQFTEPMGRLLALYANRPDLQSTFPEAKSGDYSRLLKWARDVLSAGQDSASSQLADSAKWYKKNDWFMLREKLAQRESAISSLELDKTKLIEQLGNANRKLSQRELTVQSSEAERARLTEELNNVNRELTRRQSTIQNLEADRTKLVEQLDKANDEKAKLAENLSKAEHELSAVAGELETIKLSFGYHIMRSYAKRIDKLFPEGTRRGEVRKIVVTGFGIVGREGIRSFLRQAWEKLKKREFRIIEPKKSYTIMPVRQYPATVKEAPLQPQAEEQAVKVRLNLFLSQPSTNLVFPLFKDPLVSIVIPTFNRAEYLYQCLESILAFADVPFELIVVDDCSSDATPDLLKKCSNVHIVRNERNLEFIGTCNRGASLAKGRYIFFLNNDVSATPRWLSTLVTTMEQYPKCGAVGAKLVRPDGTLQEAGSIIWRDGSAFGYGRDDDPLKPEYCYVREVDYCSAACLLVRTELFQKLGGFDELYLPAYYEDSDLCFGIRKLGYKVVYQPQATILHHEFGSRSFERARALCEANQPKFMKKWAEDLLHQSGYGDFLGARDRRLGKRVLVMDDQIPAPYLGSGFPRAYAMLKFLSELGFIVTFLALDNKTPWQPTTHQLQQSGIELFYGSSLNPEELLKTRAGFYDIVIISRPHNASNFLSLARLCFPEAFIIYDAEALFSMREILKAKVEGHPLTEARKKEMLKKEFDLMRQSDAVVTVSEAERETIVSENAHDNVFVWGHTHDLHLPVTPLSERRDILFVGGFTHGHPPNSDAVLHFSKELFPRIRKKIPRCRFIIVGTDPPQPVQKLASEHVVVTGFVEDLREYYERCRIFVVPLRFGAGISYKLTEAMSYGIPAVVSTIAGSGLGLRDGEEVLIANDDEEFVEKAIRLYDDEKLWFNVQRAAQIYVQQLCSPEAMKRKLADILSLSETFAKRS